MNVAALSFARKSCGLSLQPLGTNHIDLQRVKLIVAFEPMDGCTMAFHPFVDSTNVFTTCWSSLSLIIVIIISFYAIQSRNVFGCCETRIDKFSFWSRRNAPKLEIHSLGNSVFLTFIDRIVVARTDTHDSILADRQTDIQTDNETGRQAHWTFFLSPRSFAFSKPQVIRKPL